MSAVEEYSWVAEWLTQFLKSPLWTSPVQSFIDENCEIFEDGDEEENDLEFTVRHKNFCMLVDGLLTRNLADLGVTEEKFLEIVTSSGGNSDLETLVTEYLLSMDDFLTFRRMMEKRNIELELEAMTVLEEIKEKNLAVGGLNPTSADEEDTLKAALVASVDDKDITEKQLEMEDAELQHALAISLAQEEDRQKQREEEITEKTKDKEEQKKKVDEAKKAYEERVRQIEEENLQARIEIVSKAAEVQAVSKVTEAVKAEEKKQVAAAATTPAAAVSSSSPVAPPPHSSSSSSSSLPSKKTDDMTSPKKEEKKLQKIQHQAPLPTSDKVQLAPLGGKITPSSQEHAMPLGRQFAPLPGITAAAKPTFSQLKTAVVENVKQEVPAEKVAPKLTEMAKDEPSREELARRENYLKAQRDRLIKQKKQARESELDAYIEEKTGQRPDAEAKKGGKELDNAHIEMRRALAKKVKEDLLGSAGGQ